MEGTDELYKDLEALAKVAYGRTGDEVLLGIIAYLVQLAKALLERNSSLRELQARDASNKYGPKSETLEGVSGKMEGVSRSGGEEEKDAEPSGESAVEDGSGGGEDEDGEDRRKRRKELKEKLRELDREEAERRARHKDAGQPAGQEWDDLVESTVPEGQRTCPKCGTPLKRLGWREVRRLRLKRMRLVRVLERIERVFCPGCAYRARVHRLELQKRRRAREEARGSAGGASAGCGSGPAGVQAQSAGGMSGNASAEAGGSVHEDIRPDGACSCAAKMSAGTAGEAGSAAGHGGSAPSDGPNGGGKPEMDGDAGFYVGEADSMAVFPHCPADAGTLALVAVAKFDDLIPLARIEKIFARGGESLSRKTTYRWIIALGELLAPFVAFMHGWLAASRLVNADETPILVFREEGRPDKSKSYMWVFYGRGEGGPQVFYCLYAPTRSSSVAMDVLADLEDAFLQTDGYGGYSAVKKLEGVTGVSCLAHVRRRFHEVVSIVEEGAELSSGELDRASAAYSVLKGIAGVYAKEEEFRERKIPPEEIPGVREREVRPVFDRLRREIEEAQKTTPRGGLLGRACGYALAQWEGVLNYMKHPELTPDNNFLEACGMRPVAMGRKNYLFFQSPRGARAGAVLLSLILTAKVNGLNPEQYLATLVKRFKHLKDGSRALWEEILPWNIKDLEPLPKD